MKITTNNFTLFSTGTFFTLDDKPVTFEFDPELKLTLTFKEDNASEAKAEWSVIDPNHAGLLLTNFNNFAGAGFLEPVRLGTFSDKQLYIVLWVSQPNRSIKSKRIEYTTYMKGGDDNGN